MVGRPESGRDDHWRLTTVRARRLQDFLSGEDPDDAEGEPVPLEVGRELGGCRLERVLGEGGMGVVYLARHVALDKWVAVKVIREGVLSQDRALDRFQLEARLAAKLDHPNVVTVYHAGLERGLPFLVMRYVEGESLADRMRREGRLEPSALREIALGVTRGLAAAHAQGILHRDVKPSNILLGRDGSVLLSDFGLAREISLETNLIRSGSVVGTIPFLAPEILHGAPYGPQADLFALGSVLYEGLTGQHPFHDGNQASTLNRILSVDPPRPEQIAPEVPPGLANVAMRLLEKDPARRVPNAIALEAALQRASTRRPSRWPRQPWRVALTGISAGLLMFGAGLAWRRPGPTEAEPRPAEFAPPDEPVVPAPRFLEVPVSWDGPWRNLTAFPGRRFRDLPDGWRAGQTLEAGPGAPPFDLLAKGGTFLLEVFFELPDRDSAIRIGFGHRDGEVPRYLVALDWNRLVCSAPGEGWSAFEREVAVAERPGLRRLKLAWRSASDGWGDLSVSATTPDGIEFGRRLPAADGDRIRIEPLGGGLRIGRFELQVPDD